MCVRSRLCLREHEWVSVYGGRMWSTVTGCALINDYIGGVKIKAEQREDALMDNEQSGNERERAREGRKERRKDVTF